MVQKSLIWAMTVSQTKLKRKSTARIKIASSLLSSWQILYTSIRAFFSHSLIYEDQWSISSASNKGLLKDVLLNLFSQPWGHTITAVHSCFVCLDIGKTHVVSVIVTAFPWKTPGQPACFRLRLCWLWGQQAKTCLGGYRSKRYLHWADSWPVCCLSGSDLCSVRWGKCGRELQEDPDAAFEIAAHSSQQHFSGSTWSACVSPRDSER